MRSSFGWLRRCLHFCKHGTGLGLDIVRATFFVASCDDVNGRPDPHFQPGTGRPQGRTVNNQGVGQDARTRVCLIAGTRHPPVSGGQGAAGSNPVIPTGTSSRSATASLLGGSPWLATIPGWCGLACGLVTGHCSGGRWLCSFRSNPESVALRAQGRGTSESWRGGAPDVRAPLNDRYVPPR